MTFDFTGWKDSSLRSRYSSVRKHAMNPKMPRAYMQEFRALSVEMKRRGIKPPKARVFKVVRNG